jgi:uncharacterized membrane protein YkvA (DUF1232 family)
MLGGTNMDMIEEVKNPKYAESYSEEKLFKKIARFAKNVGIKLIYLALLLFYTLEQPTTPLLAKSIIVGALGYFILPTDFIPDFIPIVGFSDDFTALISAIVAVAMYVDDGTKAKAKAKLHVWFGNYDESDLEYVDKKVSGK